MSTTNNFEAELSRHQVSFALLEALQRAYQDNNPTSDGWMLSVLHRVQDSIHGGHPVLVGEQLRTQDEFLGWTARHFPNVSEELRTRKFQEHLRSTKTMTREMLQQLQALHTARTPEAQSRLDALLRIIQDTLQQSGGLSVHGQDARLWTQLDFYAWAAQHFPPPSPPKAPPSLPTASTVAAFIDSESQRMNADGFGDVETWVRTSMDKDTRLFYEFFAGPGIGRGYWIDVSLHLARGAQVSSTTISYPEDGISFDRMEEVLIRLGGARVNQDSGGASLVQALRAMNAGKQTTLLRILGVKDEALPDFYYVSDREKVLKLFEDHKPTATRPGEMIGVFCESTSFRGRDCYHYSPKADLAPFIEAELAKQGIVFRALLPEPPTAG
jgi:hypothetical protein